MELPPPWEIRESTKYPGRCYYFNTSTHESSWVRPIPYPGNKINWPPIIYVHHILIKHKNSSGATEANITIPQEDAKKKIKKINADLINGKKFDDMANEFSDDKDTKDNGGAIGWIFQGQMPVEFDQIAWQLRIGEMSPVVETKLGYHLILRRG